MDLDNLYNAILKSGQSLVEGWVFKTLISLLLAGIASMQGSALSAFLMLIFVDLVTRWLALCYQHLKDSGKTAEQLNICSCIVDISGAIKAGYINSDVMKHRFVGKIIVYVFLTIMAVSADNMLRIAGELPLLLKVVWIYLAVTEAMSILENLRDAGIEQAGGLLDFFRARLGVLIDRLKQK